MEKLSSQFHAGGFCAANEGRAVYHHHFQVSYGDIPKLMVEANDGTHEVSFTDRFQYCTIQGTQDLTGRTKAHPQSQNGVPQFCLLKVRHTY